MTTTRNHEIHAFNGQSPCGEGSQPFRAINARAVRCLRGRDLLILHRHAARQSPDSRCGRTASGLTGLTKLHIQIEGVEPNDVGFKSDQLRTQVELHLRRAGIKISDSPDGAFVRVVVNGWCYRDVCAGDSSVRCTSMRRWMQTPGSRPMLRHGNLAGLEIGPKATQADEMRRQLTDMLDTLANDYLAANPKPR